MLKVASLASGSSGNSLVVSDGTVHILIDAGISARRVAEGLRGLDLAPEQLSAVLITHEHADHVNGLPVLCRHTGADLCTAEPTAVALCRRWPELEPRFRVFEPGERFAVGKLTVGTFPNSHDCASPVRYTVSDGARKMALCTDTGVVTHAALEHICGAGLLVCEFNYDPDMLRNGPYPAQLKARILGRQGHLSNGTGGKLAAWAVQLGTRRVVLAHLSKENNTPDTARQAAEEAMASISARVGEDVALTVAPRSEGTGWLEVPEC